MIHIESKNKIDSVVIKETLYIGAWVLIFSAIMEAVFLAIGKWDYTVLLGNVLGAAITVLNFFLMGITVQRAVGKEEKDARQTMKTSHSLRMLMLALALLCGILLPCFNVIATVIPLLFPRIAIVFRPLFDKK
ncbi:MAG: ATP synthase subunit I [Clostridia bacterium]|nr:ATP synthase subunit I [Clostridia bacterium]